MNERIRESLNRGETRLTIAGITGGSIQISELGEKRKAVIAQRKLKLAGKRGVPVPPQPSSAGRPITPKVIKDAAVATTPVQATELKFALVVVLPKLINDDAAKSTLERTDEEAYDAGCIPKSYELELALTPRVTDFLLEDVSTQDKLRPLYRGLRRIGTGVRKRSKQLRRQLAQTDELIAAAKGEVQMLMDKRAKNAKNKLQLMDELADTMDPVAAVRSHASGRAALRLLLKQLATAAETADLSDLGPTRKLLDFVIQEAWQTRYLKGEDREWDRRRAIKSGFAESGQPSLEDRAVAKKALIAWDAFTSLDRSIFRPRSAGDSVSEKNNNAFDDGDARQMEEEDDCDDKHGHYEGDDDESEENDDDDEGDDDDEDEEEEQEGDEEEEEEQEQEEEYTDEYHDHKDDEEAQELECVGIKKTHGEQNYEQADINAQEGIKAEQMEYHDQAVITNVREVAPPIHAAFNDPNDLGKQTQQLLVSVAKAKEFLNAVPAEFVNTDAKARTAKAINAASKEGDETKFVRASAFAEVKLSFWSNLARFLPLFERWIPAQDFLWQLRYERLAAETANEYESSSSPRRNSRRNSRKELDDTKRRTHRMRNGTEIHGFTDKHGASRTIKHDDEYMNSDVIHGAGMRVKLEVLEPLLRKRLAEAYELRLVLRAELAAITQYAYDLAVVHAQRRSRGWLTRGKRKDALAPMRTLRVLDAVLSAAVMIQCRIRLYWANIEFEYRLFVLKTKCATQIQAQQRRRVPTAMRRELGRRLLRAAFLAAAVAIQRRVRISRAQWERRARARFIMMMRVTAQTTWAATIITAMGRRWLAMGAAFHRHTELQLNQRLVSLAHHYLQRGDLWAFLSAVNSDYRRYEEEANETRRREDNDAETFIRLVLEKRDAEHKGAWERYAGLRSLGNARNSVPGPRLRLLLEGLETNSPPESKIACLSPISPRCKKSRTTKVDEENLLSCRYEKNMPKTSSTQDGRSLQGESSLTSAGDERRLDFSHPAGLTVLSDVPQGLNDTLPRFLRAAALRAFVPKSFPDGTTRARAFISYLALPPSLAKTKHEMDAHEAVAPWIAAFAALGHREVWELCPPSRLEATVRGLSDYVTTIGALSSSALATSCRALLTELLRAEKSGKVQTADRFRAAISSDRITNGQAVGAARLRSIKAKGVPEESVFGEPAINLNQTATYRRMQRLLKEGRKQETPVVVAEAPAPASIEDSEAHAELHEAIATLEHSDMSARACRALEERFETYVLDDLRQHGGLDAPAAVFVARAAFFFVEVPAHPPGRASFRAFVRQSFEASHDDERALVAARARAAADYVAPFVARFDSNVPARDLVRLDLDSWGVAPELNDEIRAMLTKLAATASQQHAVDDDALRAARRKLSPLRKKTTRLRIVKLPFDARFQRGPFDPIGRPVRLDGSVAPRIRPLPPKEVARGVLYEGDVPPPREPLFGAPETAAAARAAAELPPRKRLGRSIEPEELVPLHRQPQAFVGGAHRSRNLAARVSTRAQHLFGRYSTFVRNPQLGRDSLPVSSPSRVTASADEDLVAPAPSAVGLWTALALTE